MTCWFCTQAGGPSPHRNKIETGPLCDACRALLRDFGDWLKSLRGEVAA